MHQEIGGAVSHDPKPDWPAVPEGCTVCQVKEGHADDCIKYEESVIPLKPGIVVLSVVICVEMPQEAMHNILVGKPGHEFHETKG